MIDTLAIDRWAVMFGTASRAWGAAAPPSPLLAVPHVTAQPINGQCTNFILFDVAL